MKSILITICLFFSSIALAEVCPDLTGSFTCNDPDIGEYVETITQSTDGTTTLYTVTTPEGVTTVLADNVWRNSNEGKERTRCEMPNLVTEFEGAIPDLGTFSGLAVISINAENNLHITSEVIINGQQIPSDPMTCIRN